MVSPRLEVQISSPNWLDAVLLPQDVGNVCPVCQQVLVITEVCDVCDEKLVCVCCVAGSWVCCLADSGGSGPIMCKAMVWWVVVVSVATNMTSASGSMTSVRLGVSFGLTCVVGSLLLRSCGILCAGVVWCWLVGAVVTVSGMG